METAIVVLLSVNVFFTLVLAGNLNSIRIYVQTALGLSEKTKNGRIQNLPRN